MPEHPPHGVIGVEVQGHLSSGEGVVAILHGCGKYPSLRNVDKAIPARFGSMYAPIEFWRGSQRPSILWPSSLDLR